MWSTNLLNLKISHNTYLYIQVTNRGIRVQEQCGLMVIARGDAEGRKTIKPPSLSRLFPNKQLLTSDYTHYIPKAPNL